MIKTLMTADLHLNANPRDAYRHLIMTTMLAMAKALEINRTFILGDLTEEKDHHSDWLVNKVVEHVNGFAELGPVYILQGNHDYSSDPDMPFFRFLRHLPNVRWIGQPIAFECDGLGRTLWLPHTRNFKKDWDGLTFKSFAYIFAHATFAGANFGDHRRADSGYGVPLDIFPTNAKIYSGDVHVPQKLGCVTYVGAPYTINFGDTFEPRILILDYDDKVKSMKMSGPRKHLVEVAGIEGLKYIDDQFNIGDILKVKMHITRKEADHWPEFRERVQRWVTKRGCVLHTVAPIVSERLGERVEHVQRDAKTDEEILREFARHRGIDKRTLKEGQKLL